MGKNISLTDRIKEFYEDRTKTFLNRKTITLLRLDGKGFSKLTKSLNKPFDDAFSDDMDATAIYLCQNIQGAKFAYTQSDEITIVLTDFDTLETDAWFDYNVQKMVSISASLATAKFNQLRMFREPNNPNYKLACFDSRVFQVPNMDEMVNAIIQRQQDCTRNSISMAASSCYSHKELEGVSSNEKQEMLFKKGINWDNYKVKYKRGCVIKKHEYEIESISDTPTVRTKWIPVEPPIFTQDKEFLTDLITLNRK